MTEQKCRACGARIYPIRRQESGKIIPAQRVTKIMVIQEDMVSMDSQLVDLHNVRNGEFFYISHFQTCPHPERFSRKAKSAEGGRRTP